VNRNVPKVLTARAVPRCANVHLVSIVTSYQESAFALLVKQALGVKKVRLICEHTSRHISKNIAGET